MRIRKRAGSRMEYSESKSGSYLEWERDNSCGNADLTGGHAWITLIKAKRFPDVEGPKHGSDNTYALGYRWPGGRIDGEYYSRYHTVRNDWLFYG